LRRAACAASYSAERNAGGPWRERSPGARRLSEAWTVMSSNSSPSLRRLQCRASLPAPRAASSPTHRIPSDTVSTSIRMARRARLYPAGAFDLCRSTRRTGHLQHGTSRRPAHAIFLSRPDGPRLSPSPLVGQTPDCRWRRGALCGGDRSPAAPAGTGAAGGRGTASSEMSDCPAQSLGS
jgi:hypothetical protein